MQIANSLNNSLFIGEGKTQKLIAVPKIILSQDIKTTFKQNLTCMKKTQYQFSFVHFVVDDPVQFLSNNIIKKLHISASFQNLQIIFFFKNCHSSKAICHL